jgi:ABC-2 type transport system permease protein
VWFIGILGNFKQVQEIAKAVTWQRLGPEAAAYKNLTDGVVIQLWGVVLIITLFVAPFLSMRLFAEEKKQKTFELLMTTPVRAIEIVLGKYAAAIIIVGATVGMTIVYPLILSVVGSSESGSALEWSTVGLGYLAMLLLGMTVMAIGMFISSLTDSQMVAAFFTFVVALAWFALGVVTRQVEEPVRSVVSYLSFDTQLQNLMKGSFDPKAVIFFLSIIVLQIVLTHRSIEAQRWT